MRGSKRLSRRWAKLSICQNRLRKRAASLTGTTSFATRRAGRPLTQAVPTMPEKRYKWRREDYRENTTGLLMLPTGDGKGKTTAAIGTMVRAAGRGLKCCLVQFMKSKTDRYGEHESFEKLGIEIHTMGAGFTWD